MSSFIWKGVRIACGRETLIIEEPTTTMFWTQYCSIFTSPMRCSRNWRNKGRTNDSVVNTSNTRSSVAEGKLLTKSPPCWTVTRFHGVKQTARAIIFHCRPVPCPTIARGQNNKIEQETHEYVACPSKLSFIYFTSCGVLKIGPYRLQRRRSWVTKNLRIGAGDACERLG